MDKWGELARLRVEQQRLGLDPTFTRLFVPYWRKWIRTHASRDQYVSVLDVGCGAGALTNALSEEAGVGVLGIDPSASAIEVGAMFQSGRSRLLVSHADALAKERPGEFDLVVAHMVLQAVEDPRSILAAIRRLLAQNGHAGVAIPHPANYPAYRADALGSVEYAVESSHLIPFRTAMDDSTTHIDVPYFHRPLSEYVSCFAAANLAIVAVCEPMPQYLGLCPPMPAWDEPHYITFTLRPL